jgi:uncharacterized repeat protein (TIGR02543 family)
VNKGTVINLPDKGYLDNADNIFVGWNENASGNGTSYSVGASVTVTRNMEFYTQWLDGSTLQYTVIFNANGATSGAAPSAETAYQGVSITIPGQGTLAYSGKTFGGWNTQANGGGTNYVMGGTYTVTGNVTLYAKWQSVIQYTVTYSANGASSKAPDALTVDPGTVITLPDTGNLTNGTKVFTGWNTQANGGGTSYAVGASFTVSGNITFYAKWENRYTITFAANGGSGNAPASQTVDPGTVITLPGVGNMSYSGKTFDGWNTNSSGTGTDYAAGAAYTVNADAILHAKWVSIPVEPPGGIFESKLSWIASNAESNSNYVINLDYDEGIGPTSLSYTGKSNIILYLRSTAMRTISLSSNGILFTVGSGVTLVLDSNITLQGRSSNDNSFVRVNTGGTFIMRDGTKITGNTISGSQGYGGGVYMNGGTFTMNGGEISGNAASTTTYGYNYGGGVYVASGTFTMSGGKISSNTISGYDSGRGGGVYVSGGIFTMKGGEISGNTAINRSSSSTYYGCGGGVYVVGGTFEKTGGIIYGYTSGDSKSNTVKNSSDTVLDNSGHAVYASNNSNVKRRESNAGPEVYLYFRVANNVPTWSGAWEF